MKIGPVPIESKKNVLGTKDVKISGRHEPRSYLSHLLELYLACSQPLAASFLLSEHP